LSNDPVWEEWSVASFAHRSLVGPIFINEVIYAELSSPIASEPQLRQVLVELRVELARTPEPALFAAGKAYHRYRASGGIRTGVPPDFFIGAHAQFAGWPILTRDRGRYRTYFPDVQLITPEREPH
jgi:predicted nucleic acid-binding protein